MTENKTSFPPLNRDWLIYGLSLIFDLAVGGVWFVVTRRLADFYKEQGVSDATTALHLGAINGGMFVTYTLGTLISGRLSDRYGRQRLMILGGIVYTIAAVAFLTTAKFWWLLVLFMLLGLGGSIYWPPAIAWLSEGKSGAQLRWSLGCFCVAWNVGILLGNSLGGLLYAWSPTNAIAIFAGMLAVGTLLVRLPSRVSTGSRWADRFTDGNPASVIDAKRFAIAAWVGNFAAVFCLNGVGGLFPQLATQLGIAPEIHGQLMAAGRFTAIAAFIGLQVTIFWRHRSWPLVLSQAIGIVGVVLIAIGDVDVTFAVAFLLVGLAQGFTYYASIYYSLEAYAEEKGKGSGFHEAVLGAGLALGPFLSGWVGSLASPGETALRAPYWFCAWIFALGLLAQFILSRRRTATPTPAPTPAAKSE